MGKTLHILNGDSLLEGVTTLQLDGDVLVWREMLCAGPVCGEVGGERFFERRSQFLSSRYEISQQSYQDAFVTELNKVESLSDYASINLWFEYDLFCHINLLGALAWVTQHNFSGSTYHICSGRVKGAQKLMGLSELSQEQLLHHFQNKKQLSPEDMESAYELWQLYCSEDHNAIIPKITNSTSFDYLTNCLKSHIERFPNRKTGLNVLETHILKLLNKHTIKSEHQLCGYVLDQQGYYGYGDMQILKSISNLRPFFAGENGSLKLNETGIKVLNNEVNVFEQIANGLEFGGARKYDWLYDTDTNQLVKSK